MEYPLICLYVIVSAGLSTSMSFSKGLYPSIFCRKMGNMGPLKKERDGKSVYFPLELAFSH